MSESFAELFEESLKKAEMRPGSIVTGKVEDIRGDYVVVDAGFKSEGIIPIDQFYDEGGVVEVNIGDEVEVALETVEDGFGETRLSREKAKRASAWKELEKAHEGDETVMGLISGKVKGGFTVELKHIRAFLPGSLVDVRPVRDTSYLEGKELEFKVIKLDRQRITLSYPVALLLRKSIAKSVKISLRACRKVLKSRVSLRTLLITVRSSSCRMVLRV